MFNNNIVISDLNVIEKDYIYYRYFLADEQIDFKDYCSLLDNNNKNDKIYEYRDVKTLNDYIYNSVNAFYPNCKEKLKEYNKDYWDILLSRLQKEMSIAKVNNNLEILNTLTFLLLDINVMRNFTNVNKAKRLDEWKRIISFFEVANNFFNLLYCSINIINLIDGFNEKKEILEYLLDNYNYSIKELEMIDNDIKCFIISNLYKYVNINKINNDKIDNIIFDIFNTMDNSNQFAISFILYDICPMKKKYQNVLIKDYCLGTFKIVEEISIELCDEILKLNKDKLNNLLSNLDTKSNTTRLKIFELLDLCLFFINDSRDSIYEIYLSNIFKISSDSLYMKKSIFKILDNNFVLFSNKYVCLKIDKNKDNDSSNDIEFNPFGRKPEKEFENEFDNFIYMYAIDILCLLLNKYDFFEKLSDLSFIDVGYYSSNLNLDIDFISDFINRYNKDNYYLCLLKFNNRFEKFIKDLCSLELEFYTINEFSGSEDTFSDFLKKFTIIDLHTKHLLYNTLVSRSGSNLRNFISHSYFKFDDFNLINSSKCYLILFLLLNKQFLYYI